ncbi:uncharacterized protein LOC135811797 isoform X2 [Sycon ciliatum]|uniref:uncharacterized protein LOC135811797 isoform X2 n=1 Tax=Sycon ciliatum TaxID=27933 RepID=UPI0031F5F308
MERSESSRRSLLQLHTAAGEHEESWRAVLNHAAPTSVDQSHLTVQQVSAVQKLLHARRVEQDDVLESMRSSAAGSDGQQRRRFHQRSSRRELQPGTSSSRVLDAAGQATCSPGQLPGLINTMELRHDTSQRLAWDFRSLDVECTGRLPLHQCVVLFAANLGSKFSRRVWNDFRAQQVARMEQIGDLGGASLEEIRQALLPIATTKHTEVGMSAEEMRALLGQELHASQSRSMVEYRQLEDGISALEEDAEKQERAARGRELRAAAQRRIARFRVMAMSEDVSDEENALGGGGGGGGVDARDGKLAESFVSANLQASFLSMQSAGSGDTAASSSLVKEQHKLDQAQSVWDVLERKYDALSEKLLATTAPPREKSSSLLDVRQLRGNAVRMVRAGRLDEAEKMLSEHARAGSVMLLLGSTAAAVSAAGNSSTASGNSSTASGNGAVLVKTSDFIPLSSPGRALAELRLRQSQERDTLSEQMHKEGATSKTAAGKAKRRLQLQISACEAEKSFDAASLCVGLFERAHRPATLDSHHPDRVRCQVLAHARLPQLLNSADLFQDFAVLAKRLASDTLLPSGVEEGGDRLSLEQSILKLLLHSHVTEQTVLVWLLEGTGTEHSDPPPAESLSQHIGQLEFSLGDLTRRRGAWIAERPNDMETAVEEHQSILCSAAQLARDSSWRWYQGDLTPLSATAGPLKLDGVDQQEAGRTRCPRGVLVELLAQLQEVQLEEIESTMAEMGRKDEEALRSIVSRLHQSLVGLHVNNVASVLLRLPPSEEQWRDALIRTSIQAKFRALQDVLLHESLACGDGTTLSQKDWNALPVQLKREELETLRIDERTNRSEPSPAGKALNKMVHSSARVALADHLPGSGSQQNAFKSVPQLLEEMCANVLSKRMDQSSLHPIDRQMPGAVVTLITGAPCFADAVTLALSGKDIWSPFRTTLPWQLSYHGMERFELLNIHPSASLGWSYTWPLPVVKETMLSGALQALACCQVMERQMLCTLITAVLKLRLAWQEVSTMEEVELKGRLQELTGGAVTYWEQDDKTRELLQEQYQQCAQEAAVINLQQLQDEKIDPTAAGDDAYSASPVLSRGRAIAKLWRRCFELHSRQLQQISVYVEQPDVTASACTALHSCFQQGHSGMQLLQTLSSPPSHSSTVTYIDTLLFSPAQDPTDPYAVAISRLETQIESPVLTRMLATGDFEALTDIARLVNACPLRKIKMLRRRFLALVSKQHERDRPSSAVSSSASPSSSSPRQSVMDTAEEIVIFEQSLDGVSSKDSDELAEILALHPGGEDSFQELCWLLSEMGLLPKQEERAGEMDKSSAAVSIIQTLAKLGRQRAKAMQQWSNGITGSSAGSSEASLREKSSILQCALAYQLYVLDCLGAEHDDINMALLVLLIKSMMSLRIPQGQNVGSITYSSDWYYHNQLLAQRCVQAWQSRTCVAITYDSELTVLVERDQRRVETCVTSPVCQASYGVSSRVTMVRELLNQRCSVNRLEVQILLLLLQLCDLDRPGMEELTEQSPEDLKSELQRRHQDYDSWHEEHADNTLHQVNEALKIGECGDDWKPLAHDDVTTGLGILHDATAVRAVLTMWQCDEREASDDHGVGGGQSPEEQEPMAVLMLRQLVCCQQQTEDRVLRDSVAMTLPSLQDKLVECLVQRSSCHWQSLVDTIFSVEDFSKPTTGGDSMASSQAKNISHQFGMRLYRLTTMDLYGALDTKLQEKLKRKNKKVRKRKSSNKLPVPLAEPVVVDNNTPALGTTERTKEFEDKHRMMMSDLLTTYNRMREDKLKKQQAQRGDGGDAEQRRVRFSSSSTNVLRHAEAAGEGQAVAGTDQGGQTSRKRRQSAAVNERLRKRRVSRSPRPPSAETAQPHGAGDEAQADLAKQEASGDGEVDTTNAPEYGGQEYDEEGDDVPLPDGLGGDEEEEEAQSEEEEEESEEEFRPLTSWGANRPRTGLLRTHASAASVAAGGAPTRPLTRMEEDKLNKRYNSSDSDEDTTPGQERKTSKAQEELLKAKQQLLREKTLNTTVDFADGADGRAVRTATVTQELAKKEKGRQRQEALRRHKERLAAKNAAASAGSSVSPDSKSPLAARKVSGGPVSVSPRISRTNADGETSAPTADIDEMEQLRGTMATRMQEEKNRQQERMRTRGQPQTAAPPLAAHEKPRDES